MGKSDFIASRRPSWEELEKILARVKRHGIRSLHDDELSRLGTLYRSVTADLAKARGAEPFGDVTSYLNQLVAKTHAVIYVSRPKLMRAFLRFITLAFPSVIRKHSKTVLISTLLFMLPAFLGYYWMAVEPESMYRMFPGLAMEIEFMESQIKDQPGLLASGMISPDMMPIASSLIMVNNILISIYAFAAGLTFGLITIFLLVFNGTMLGGVAYLYFSRTADYATYFLAGVLPHAVIELTAIVFSGGAGLIIGGALLMPGNLKRVDALRIRGKDAMRIMYGVIIMLVIAALIEGFITPIKNENYQLTIDWVKIVGSIIVAMWMTIYFVYAGRNSLES